MKENDILYSSWGYDQTNVDFYKVVKLSGSFATIVNIPRRIVRSVRGSDFVMPVTDPVEAKHLAMRRKIHGSGSGEYLKIKSYAYAWLWDGKEIAKTASGYGH